MVSNQPKKTKMNTYGLCSDLITVISCLRLKAVCSASSFLPQGSQLLVLCSNLRPIFWHPGGRAGVPDDGGLPRGRGVPRQGGGRGPGGERETETLKCHKERNGVKSSFECVMIFKRHMLAFFNLMSTLCFCSDD